MSRRGRGVDVDDGEWCGTDEQLELRRRLGDGGGRAARLHRRHPGRPQRRLARVRPRRRRHRAVPARPRRRAAGQGGALPLQLARVPADHLRRGQGRPRPGQHQLPLRRRRAELPVGQRRRHRRRLPRGVRRPHRGHPRPRARGEGMALGRRRLGAVPRLGHPVRGRGQVRHRPGVGAVGPQRRRPLHALHRRHHRHAQGRDVAPGRSLRPADRQRRAPLPRRRRHRGRARLARGQPGRRHHPAGLPAHARDRQLHRQHHVGRGRAGLPARVAQVRPRRDARHH